jgi:hypothetical protein
MTMPKRGDILKSAATIGAAAVAVVGGTAQAREGIEQKNMKRPEVLFFDHVVLLAGRYRGVQLR